MRDVVHFLRTEKSYSRLLVGSLISGLGDALNNVAILGLLLYLTGSGLAVGVTLAMRTMPVLVIGPLGGILADRVS